MITVACIPVMWLTSGRLFLIISMEKLVTSNSDHNCDGCCR